MRPADSGELQLWLDYRQSRDLQARDRLFSHHAPWARSVALSVHRRVWSLAAGRSDCIQNATVGLLEAMERFDPRRGIPFRAYATPRVRGAVFNGLRALRDESRAGPADCRMDERVATLLDEGSEDPLDAFIGLVTGLGFGLLLEASESGLVDDQGPAAALEANQLHGRIKVAVGRLADRHRQLIEHHYFHHLPFSDMALQWGLTKGRVSQLHKEAIARLRKELCEP